MPIGYVILGLYFLLVLIGAALIPVTVLIEDYYESKYMERSLDSGSAFAIGLATLMGAWIIVIPFEIHRIRKADKHGEEPQYDHQERHTGHFLSETQSSKGGTHHEDTEEPQE